MLLFGLTGGVGMGKSTVAGLFEKRGAKLIDTDQIARELTRAGGESLAEIVKVFGKGILSEDGELNRIALAEIVFANTASRVVLEKILHPRIRAGWEEAVKRVRGADAETRWVAVVIPLLFETGAESSFDKTICVACSARTQTTRLISRGWSMAQIQARNEAQMAVGHKMDKADYVIWNEAGLDVSDGQLEKIVARKI